jgi:hypothetical protein
VFSAFRYLLVESDCFRRGTFALPGENETGGIPHLIIAFIVLSLFPSFICLLKQTKVQSRPKTVGLGGESQQNFGTNIQPCRAVGHRTSACIIKEAKRRKSDPCLNSHLNQDIEQSRVERAERAEGHIDRQ